jgi:selenocysteine lyase/cysteine desulfurase
VVDAGTHGTAIRWRDVVGSKHTAKARLTAAAMLGTNSENIIFGSSASMLLRIVAVAYSQLLQPGDEIVVCDWAHESQIAPWVFAAELSNATVKWCHIDREGGGVLPPPSAIAKLCGPKTKIVTLTHVSNVLGTVYDVKEATKLIKSKSDAAVVVDGVAFVPHMSPQVESIGCDWYVFSCYKAYGPHTAAIYGSTEALTKLKSVSQNHKFIKPSKIGPERWELGTSNQEGAAAMVGLAKYFRSLASFVVGEDVANSLELNKAVSLAYQHMNMAEQAPAAKLLEYLNSNPRVKIVGNPTMEVNNHR